MSEDVYKVEFRPFQEELVRVLIAKHELCQPVVANMETTELREGSAYFKLIQIGMHRMSGNLKDRKSGQTYSCVVKVAN